eukprot:g10713.t1
MLPTKLACFMCFSFLWFGVGGFILLLGIASKDALSYRSAAIDKIVRENFTSDNLKEVLSLVGKSLTDSIQIPADRALESVWGSLRSLHAFNESWDGSIEEPRRA